MQESTHMPLPRYHLTSASLVFGEENGRSLFGPGQTGARREDRHKAKGVPCAKAADGLPCANRRGPQARLRQQETLPWPAGTVCANSRGPGGAAAQAGRGRGNRKVASRHGERGPVPPHQQADHSPAGALRLCMASARTRLRKHGGPGTWREAPLALFIIPCPITVCT